MEKQLRVATYARVSKTVQDEEMQTVAFQNAAKTFNYEIVASYVDFISGGTSNRPQFQTMMSDAKLRKFDLILVWALDRFSREGILNTLGYLEILKKNNVALKSIKESWVDTTNEGVGELMISFAAWMAKQEKLRISQRILEKYALIKETLASGKPYKAKNGKLITHLGRRAGARDKAIRNNQNYLLRWARVRNAKNNEVLTTA